MLKKAFDGEVYYWYDDGKPEPKLKCFVGNLNGNYRGLVVATSKKKAAAVAGTSLYDFNRYWHKAISVKIGEFKPDTLYRKRFDSQEPWTEK